MPECLNQFGLLLSDLGEPIEGRTVDGLGLDDGQAVKTFNDAAGGEGQTGLTGLPLQDGIGQQSHHIEHQSQEQVQISCPKCSKGHLAQRVSRYGKTFYACDSYPKCKYVVNYQPLNQSCPECDWGILIEKKGASGTKIQCPQKKCGYKIEKA